MECSLGRWMRLLRGRGNLGNFSGCPEGDL